MRVTLREIAIRKGVTWHAIRKRKLKEGWQSCGTITVNHKPAEEFEVAYLPDDLKALFPEHLGNIPVVDGDKAHATEPSTAYPPSEQGRVSRAPAQLTRILHDATDGIKTQSLRDPATVSFIDQEQSRDPSPAQLAPAQPETHPAPAHPSLLPAANATEIARPSTTDILNQPNHAAIPEKAKKVALARMDLLRIWKHFRGRFDSLAQGDHDFERWYQTGHSTPHLYNVLGNISVSALKKWDKSLEGSSDWRKLVPNYRYKGMAVQSSLTLDVRKIFERFLLDPRRHKISMCIFYTRHALELRGIPCEFSDAVFYRYVEWFKKTHNDVWVFRREGNKALWDKVLLYIKRDAGILEVGDCLVADGHRLNFQIINPLTGRPVRATMIGYLDWKSYDMAGYEIMIEENTQCIASAMRHSMLKLGKAPRFCYQDNGKAFRAKYFTNSPSFEEAGFAGLFARFNIIPVFSLPFNARAKVIERWWGIFTDSFERLLPSYVGASIDDKPAYLKRNEKFHKTLRGEYTPTIWEAVEMIDQWLSLWGSRNECPHAKGKTIRQVFDEGRGPGINAAELDDLMLDAKVTKLYQNGVKMWGEYYWHETLYGKQYSDVIVRYSIFDKSTVRVYASNGTFICTAIQTSNMNPLVNYLGTEAEKEQFKNVIQMRARLRKKTINAAKQIEEAPLPIAVNMTASAAEISSASSNQVSSRPGTLMLQQAEARRAERVIQKAGTYDGVGGYECLEEERPVRPQKPLIVYEFQREDAEEKYQKDMAEYEESMRAYNARVEESMISAGPLMMDLDRQIVKAAGEAVKLHPMEFRLLHLLMKNRGKVFDRSKIAVAITRNEQAAEPRAVDVHITRLRAALKKVGAERFILTKHGAGYFFSEED